MKSVLIGLSMAFMLMLGGCLIIGSGGCNCDGGGQEKAYADFNGEQACSASKTLRCRTEFGSITVNAGSEEKAVVSAHYFAAAKEKARAEELLLTTSVKFEVTDSEIIVELLCPDKKNNESCGADITVTVPASTQTELDSSYGAIKVTGLQGDCRADTSFANIEAENITGELDLSTSYGDVKVVGCMSGLMKLNTSFKGIEVRDSKGEVQADTSYGKIELVNNTLAKVRLNTSFGPIEFDGSAAGANLAGEFRTSYGKVTLIGMDKFAGKIKMSTSYGEVKSELPITVTGSISQDKLSGTIGSGSGDITVENSFGDIVIK
ncbi:MAG: DUF4097 family beta strand repeat protein [Sedimentisphaerales bacterium]|nr:DUF4097 family beta strand repeat protein [Sedimentisphaerales bacterium]